MSVRWYVGRTEPRAEYLAEDQLQRDGFRVYLPRVKATNLRPRNEYVPLFPGYIFLGLDQDQDEWPSLRAAHRLLGWVRFGGETPWIPDQLMTQLKHTVQEINGEGGLWRRFKVGDKVKVVSGTIEGVGEVVWEGKSHEARVQVLLEFMGRLIRAQIPREYIWHVQDEPVDQPRLTRRTRGRGRWIREAQPVASPGQLA